MKTTITVETDDTVKIHTEAKTAEDIGAEFILIFGGMVACIKEKFGDEKAAALIASAYIAGRDIMLSSKDECDDKKAEYKEPK